MTTTGNMDRRTLLRAAAGAAVAGTAMAVSPAFSKSAAAATTDDGEVVEKRLLVVDKDGGQRFLADTPKPPVHVAGRTLPASARQGDPDATYLIFNDEDENEKGGIIASRDGAFVGLDYANAQGMSMQTFINGNSGGAQLSMSQMPNPNIDPTQITSADSPQRVVLGTSTGDGALLALADSKGKPRILLQVDANDKASISILDKQGRTVAKLP